MGTRVLLHTCCAPCAAPVVERLRGKWEVTLFFYGPNIHLGEEYLRRLEAARALSRETGTPLVEGRDDTAEWFRRTRGREGEKEGGIRCEICIHMRLEETARTARDGDYDAFATTLTVGPRKRAEVVNSLGARISGKYGVWFLSEDFKKKGGFQRSLEMSREMGLYRQSYCGCLYSLRASAPRTPPTSPGDRQSLLRGPGGGG
jgi:predicted adenine nucleotide alpha hydrolase (AANH) superfamily ATPase